MSQTLISRPVTQVVAELSERCDRCSAPAKLTLQLTAGGALSFCGHHGNRFAGHILAIAQRVAIESGYDWRGVPSPPTAA